MSYSNNTPHLKAGAPLASNPVSRSDTIMTAEGSRSHHNTVAAPTGGAHRFSNVFHHQRPGTSSSRPYTSSTAGTVPGRQNSVQTKYMEMLLGLDTIPRLHNIMASFATWILLAGFIIFPGTFTTIQRLDDSEAVQGNQVASSVLDGFKNTPLLVIAGICCGIGAAGMIWLWWTWRTNYVWLLNKIFMPGCLNSLAGFISTLANVYGQQHGVWSVTAQVTAIVTGVCMGVTAILFAVYNFWVLKRVKQSHARELSMDGRASYEGFVEKIERKAKEPALEPGSVV